MHQDLLTITGDPMRGLQWKVACEDLTRSVREELDPSVRGPLAPAPAVEVPSEPSDWKTSLAPELATVVIQALRRLEWPEREAKDLLARACERLRAPGRNEEARDAAVLVKEANRIGLSLPK